MLTLLYHNLLSQTANGVPVASNQVLVEAFAEQMHRLRHQLCDPYDVHKALTRGRKPSGVLVTFDDGASGVLEAARILAKVGAVGLVFICPGTFSNGLWFYNLADALSRSKVRQSQWDLLDLPLTSPTEKLAAYQVISNTLFDLSENMRAYHMQNLLQLLEPLTSSRHPALTIMNETDLHEVAKTGAIVFGNHSWSHGNLVNQNDVELLHEIEAAQTWLENSALPILPWFAFPRGRYNQKAIEIVAQFCPIMFGMCAVEKNKQILPRVAINGLDRNRMRFWLKTSFDGRLLGRIIQPLRAAAQS